MNLEVKNIKVNLVFSKETICFMADIFVNGKKAIYADNHGEGGCTNTSPYTIEDKQIYNDVVNYLKSISKDEYEKCYPLENFIDNFICKYIDEKEKKKFIDKRNKNCEKYLVMFKDNEDEYETIGWGKHTISDLLKHKQGIEALKKSIDKYRLQGYKFYNKNIPLEILN